MAGGIGVLGDELLGYAVGLIFALALFVLHHAALQVEGLLIERAEQVAHAVGLQPERVIERRGGDVLEVVGAVVIGGAVEVGGAHLLHGVDVAAVEVFAAAEHQVLEEVREAGLAGLFVLRADVIPDVDGHDGGFVVFVDDHGQAVVEDEFLVGDPLAYLGEQLEAWKRAGTYQRLRVLESESAAESRFDGKDVINLASNNYLGLTTHPKLREAALEATRRYGVGSGAVRTISGTMSLHMQLEERIARFKNVEACVVFQSGFAANAGTVAAVLTPEDHIISDELNHASIIDGCRLSRAKIHVFPHKDTAAAERKLAELDGQPGRKLLITDGVFSMDGDIGPLPGLVEAAEKHGAIMMVDDAHSPACWGATGAAPSTISACTGACISRWARFRRPSGCWADMCAAAAR
jgi:hypothetical protein